MEQPTLNVRVDNRKVAKPVDQIDYSDLEWYATSCTNPEKAAIARAELKRRGKPVPAGGGGQRSAPARTPQPNTELALRHAESARLAPTTDPQAITKYLVEQAKNYNVIAPATVVQSLPPGFEVATSIVMIDPTPKTGDVYEIKGTSQLGLGKHALTKISIAAAVSWTEARRLDDRSDPHYCEMFVKGSHLLFDGTKREVSDVADLDLRDGSPRIQEESAKAIKQARKFIMRTCTSMAKSRAIDGLGVKRSYTAEELAKPFSVNRLMFTGKTDDPELARVFAVMKAAEATGATNALFGGSLMPALGPAADAPQLGGGDGYPVHDTDGVVPPSAPDNDAPQDDDDVPPAATGTDGANNY